MPWKTVFISFSLKTRVYGPSGCVFLTIDKIFGSLKYAAKTSLHLYWIYSWDSSKNLKLQGQSTSQVCKPTSSTDLQRMTVFLEFDIAYFHIYMYLEVRLHVGEKKRRNLNELFLLAQRHKGSIKWLFIWSQLPGYFQWHICSINDGHFFKCFDKMITIYKYWELWYEFLNILILQMLRKVCRKCTQKGK